MCVALSAYMAGGGKREQVRSSKEERCWLTVRNLHRLCVAFADFEGPTIKGDDECDICCSLCLYGGRWEHGAS